MTVKFTALYTKPDDAAAFDQHYFDVHVPITKQWPNVERAEVARVVANPMGGEPAYYLMFEAWFADMDAFRAAMGSESGKEAATDFGRIAPPGSVLLISETAD